MSTGGESIYVYTHVNARKPGFWSPLAYPGRRPFTGSKTLYLSLVIESVSVIGKVNEDEVDKNVRLCTSEFTQLRQ